MSTTPLTLFGSGPPQVHRGWSLTRVELDPCCWYEHCRGFLDGADTLLSELIQTIDWQRGRRLMYGSWHREPRLTGSRAREQRCLPSSINEIRQELTARCDRTFSGLFCNYYETGQDSVAWHADRIGRTELDPLVAIVSLGGPRKFLLRPQGGGSSHKIQLCSGDLLVMGGATQHHWEHSVPKTRHAYPRLSVTMRAGGPPLSLQFQSRQNRAQTSFDASVTNPFLHEAGINLGTKQHGQRH
jgi:alkylated DNA repair dioxygenase AlkB